MWFFQFFNFFFNFFNLFNFFFQFSIFSIFFQFFQFFNFFFFEAGSDHIIDSKNCDKNIQKIWHTKSEGIIMTISYYKLLLPSGSVSHNDFNFCSHVTKIKINTTLCKKMSISKVKNRNYPVKSHLWCKANLLHGKNDRVVFYSIIFIGQ